MSPKESAARKKAQKWKFINLDTRLSQLTSLMNENNNKHIFNKKINDS